ncbi:MAG TPA: M28 family peptidase [Thermoanaerobaculia bacterium]|nr:M28 family peptidase [Thermoanaerobaculia bacterium]
MKRCLLLLLLATPLFAQTFEQDVRTLAAPEMEGRGLGTKGILKAGDYIESRLKAIGLQVTKQPFPVKTGVALGANNHLDGLSNDDWTPLGFSSSGDIHAPIVFAGYGISAPPLNYDDFAGVDVKGKVALMLRYEPQEKDDNSPFDGRKPSRWSALRYKAMQARERGAVAVIFVTGPLQDEKRDGIPMLKNDGPQSPAGIPVLQVKTSIANKWLGGNLEQWQKDVDKDLKPRSRVLEQTLNGHVDVKATYADTANYIGTLPGKGALASDIVVLGAHYDHLGYGGEGSMKPNEHAIHPGADDNASGTAGVLQSAARVKALLANVPSHRTVLFTLFSAEESGLGGSSYFVEHYPMEHVVAMVNLDMIGMLKDETLVAFGSDSAPEWKAQIDKIATVNKLTIKSSGDGYGPSDQTSFYASHVPVIHFFTGAHERYHTPEDKAEFLNYAGADKAVAVTTDLVASLARGELTPHYARTTAAPAMEGDSRGYGAYLGTVPDYRAMEASEGGVLLSDVRPGSPAEKAGIKGGDKIVSMAGTRIENLYDMTYALQDHKPGDTIEVIVVRSNERVPLRATLGQRGGGQAPSPAQAAERHLKDIKQLTFGGENAEAYWSPDGKKLIYQSTPKGAQCDQEYVLDVASGQSTRVSSGKGRTTCGYFSYPNGERIIYATTEGGGAECPPQPDRSQGYVWAIYPSYDIVTAKPDGSGVKKLTNTPGYDAEATWCHKGGKFVFTSMRDGDLDLYEMRENGKVKRLTNTPGYDGGAFYNADCTEIAFRANHPTGTALDDYRALLAKSLVRPTTMELFVMNADGTNQRQITHNGAANFCPYFTPDGKKIIYSSNAGDPKGREFDVYLISKEGGEAERITTAPGFDGFPMFSPDGKWLVWASNRADPSSHETNLFLARWE